jgi:aryl carrier-like protein
VRDRVLAARGRRRLQLLVDHLQRVAAELLGLSPDDIDVDRPFNELGLDSVTAVDLAERAGRDVGVALQGTVLFDHPTIEALARHLADRLDPG